MLRNISEARAIIVRFINIVKGKDECIETNNIQLQRKDQLIQALEKKCNVERKFTKEVGRLRQYYQTLLFKVVRELRLMEGDPKKEAVFAAIHELDDDLNYQRHI